VAKFCERMETKRFLRKLAEARRRYGGSVDGRTAVLDRRPPSPPLPEPQDEPTTDGER